MPSSIRRLIERSTTIDSLSQAKKALRTFTPDEERSQVLHPDELTSSSILATDASVELPVQRSGGLTDGTKGDLIDQVRQLSSSTQSVEDSFSKISITLDELCLSKLPPEASIAVINLSKKWKQSFDMYRSLIWKSRDMAGDARVISQDFADILIGTVLTDPDVSLTDKKEAIRGYTQLASKEKTQSQELVDSFNKLAIDISSFCEDWERVVIKHRLFRFSFRWKETEEKIQNLNSRLKKTKLKVVSLSIVLGFLVAAAGAGALAVLFAMHGNSTISIGTLAGIPIRFVASHLEAALAQKKDIIEQLKDLENDHESGESDIADIKNIASKLGGIACIWACIRADLKYIEGILERALSTPDIESMHTVFDARLKTIRETYTSMAEVFREYQVAVNGQTKISVV